MAYVFETVPAHRALIDLNDPREVNWWRKRFDCSEEQLRKAVAEVGTSAARVEQLLDGSEVYSLSPCVPAFSGSPHPTGIRPPRYR